MRRPKLSSRPVQIVAAAVAVVATYGGSVAATCTCTLPVFSGRPFAVAMTSPPSGTVSGSAVSVAATVTPNGNTVSGVQFKLNGSNLGVEDTTSPYAITWDSTGSSDGSYTLAAVARVSDGRTKTSTGVSVTVSNGATPSVWVATTGNDSTCVRGDVTKPCLTPWKAFQIAHSGDGVQVAGGTYSNWGDSSCSDYSSASTTCMHYDATKTSAVTFFPAPGQTVNFTGLVDFEGTSWLTIDGKNRWNIVHGSVGITPQNTNSCGHSPNDVTLENMSWNGPFTINNGVNVLLKNIDVGGFSYIDGAGQDAWGDSSRIQNSGGCTPKGSNITLDTVHWHDIYRGDSGSHDECIFIHEIDQLTIKNSFFDHCPFTAILFQSVSPGQSHMTIQNDIFTTPCPNYSSPTKPGNVVLPGGGQTDCGSTAMVEANCNDDVFVSSNWNISFNTMIDSSHFFQACEAQAEWNSTDLMYGNVGGDIIGTHSPAACSGTAPPIDMANWTVGNNVWMNGSKCAASDQTSTAGVEFNNAGAGDYTLKAGAKAIDAVPTGFGAGCPATDFAGHTRPVGSACDAGAYER